jgi:integrase
MHREYKFQRRIDLQSIWKNEGRTPNNSNDSRCRFSFEGPSAKSGKDGISIRISVAHDIQKPIGSVKKAHQTAMKRAKIKRHFRLYDLRHTFATRAVASRLDLPTLSALLGHASIQMTMRYVHPAAEQKRVAIQEFDKFNTEGIVAAATAAAQQNQRVTTKVTTAERIN